MPPVPGQEETFMHTALPLRPTIAALALMLASFALAAHAAPSTALLQRCAACHGATGNTAAAALYPNLAGQSAPTSSCN
jgi:cytochrome c553